MSYFERRRDRAAFLCTTFHRSPRLENFCAPRRSVDRRRVERRRCRLVARDRPLYPRTRRQRTARPGRSEDGRHGKNQAGVPPGGRDGDEVARIMRGSIANKLILPRLDTDPNKTSSDRRMEGMAKIKLACRLADATATRWRGSCGALSRTS